MKLTINQNSEIQETEITINCPVLDQRVRNLVDYIRQYSITIEGTVNESTSFVRISKNCIVNLAYVQSTTPCNNHRLEIALANGEHLIAARSYKDIFQKQLRDFQADAFHIPPFYAKDILEHNAKRSIYNAGKMLDFPSCPKRVVALSYDYAEILAALGMADRLIAISPAEGSIEQVLPKYRAALENIPLLTHQWQGVPHLSELKELEPDLVIGSYYSLITLERRAGAKISDYNINMYVAEGTIPERATLESAYKDILNMGKIFHVENISIQIVEQMRSRVEKLLRWVDYRSPVRVFAYDSKEATPFTSKRFILLDAYLIFPICHISSCYTRCRRCCENAVAHGLCCWI